ncbi:DUF1692-domain-containing protein [Eremomyces bilateralis CBS 781.70]|uniref:Endoplasmic reticulum-Golgi intermediate compartment protein n=1 Tax=Eremomyces bilateralis CBS 781.70 TaxID=1392243 RepID=A0A6G1GAR4_9PEZI|nr:DUF1692-domain-containing protein [Eremomyces bilateralis CBS 781.70]KAF1815114.1 DUF1692-domain-containing protein [Eremomyces bilateralis CBS 781.70]
MNGFADHGLSASDFETPKGGFATFDAFPKTKATYLTRTRTGSAWTLLLIVTTVYLCITEIRRWVDGTISHNFSVEKGIGHQLQMNLDIIMAMKCEDLRINVQDASGDRILAGEMLQMDPTKWLQWGGGKQRKQVHKLGESEDRDSIYGLGEDEDVHDYLSMARGRSRFPRTPKVKGEADACRIYGSFDENKVQGDFHIMARGHGYREFGDHLDHGLFNFSHQVNELSFGPYYPNLVNPMDKTIATTEFHFYKFQYYLSIVPTIYTTNSRNLAKLPQNSHNPYITSASDTVVTNQYAVTEQSHPVGEANVPGIFFKYDIEPILLLVSEESSSLFALLVRLVNVVSGVMVALNWCSLLSDWVADVLGRRQKRESLGMLHGRTQSLDKKFRYD